MRILAGIYKGRALKSPKGSQTRPTTSLMRKAVFDITAPYLEGADFLDLFAGSGAMGIEALSRGARSATFIEKDPNAIRTLSDNLTALGPGPAEARILKKEAHLGLKLLAKRGASFSLIYIDPPYDQAQELSTQILPLIDELQLLKPGGLLLLEMEKRTPLPTTPLDSLKLIESRGYGMSKLHIFGKWYN